MGDRDRAMLCSQLRNTVGEIIYKILPLQFLLCFFISFFLAAIGVMHLFINDRVFLS